MCLIHNEQREAADGNVTRSCFESSALPRAAPPRPLPACQSFGARCSHPACFEAGCKLIAVTAVSSWLVDVPDGAVRKTGSATV